MTRPVRLTVKGANIGRGVPTAVARRNMARVKHGGPTPSWRVPQIVCWQELDDDDAADERQALSDLFPSFRYMTWPPRSHGPGHLVPITWPDPWKRHAVRAEKVSDGLALVTPDRYVTRVDLWHPKLPDPVAFISFQLVAGAWTNPGQIAEPARKALWEDGWAGARRMVAQAAKEGLTVVWNADTNRPRCPPIHLLEQRVVTHGLDCLGLVPGSVAVRVRGKGVIPLDIDGHDAIWARLDLTAA